MPVVTRNRGGNAPPENDDVSTQGPFLCILQEEMVHLCRCHLLSFYATVFALMWSLTHQSMKTNTTLESRTSSTTHRMQLLKKGMNTTRLNSRNFVMKGQDQMATTAQNKYSTSWWTTRRPTLEGRAACGLSTAVLTTFLRLTTMLSWMMTRNYNTSWTIWRTSIFPKKWNLINKSD